MINSKIHVLILIAFLLSGCAANRCEIEFVTNTRIEAGIDYNACELVRSVNGKEITKFNLDGDRIIIDNDTVICPIVDTTVLGAKKVEFKYLDEIYEVTITVLDVTPPIFGIDKSVLKVQKGMNQKELIGFLNVHDDYSDFSISLEGNLDLNKLGEYDIKAIAKDDAGNCSEKSIHVIVEESANESTKREEKSINATAPVNLPSNENNVNNNKPPLQNDVDDNTSQEKKHLIAENRTFLFSEGYDYQTCYDAAISYAEEMIAQNKANGYDCTPIRNEQQEYIGYQVVFK